MVSMPLANHFMLSKSQSPKSDSELIKMENVPYSNAIGSVMYAMISTRPDLSFAISLLSMFMSNPGTEHWYALKWLLRYINSTSHVGLEYCKRGNALDLMGFVDSDFAGDRDTRKSTTSYFFTFGGNCVSWKSQLQPIVALSTTEA
ncbi:secreted RxLR effector protein 161-like [Pistacia vera]|uniref:secreted RxLR effector protein 161-like n=1 Tax=Pistacia vera TaxID=55513 RepID=UPI00126312AF|nr:secreted RxLR effector protein 161-like [Pistacia vera]